MIGIVIGWALKLWGQPLAIKWANKIYMMINFVLQGGLTADDPSTVFAEVRGISLISSTQDKLYFILALFGFLVIFTYLLGRCIFHLRPTFFGPIMTFRISWGQRFIASGLGAINSYLIARFLIPLLLPPPEAVIKIPSGRTTELLDKNLELVIIGFVIILVIFGLQASGHSRS
ncbi:MAG: hypothetical protein U9Q78_08945 [Chloroflexota bacterium]|nr:hypothetical protein [Chloroflexota bacterium]